MTGFKVRNVIPLRVNVFAFVRVVGKENYSGTLLGGKLVDVTIDLSQEMLVTINIITQSHH